MCPDKVKVGLSVLLALFLLSCDNPASIEDSRHEKDEPTTHPINHNIEKVVPKNAIPGGDTMNSIFSLFPDNFNGSFNVWDISTEGTTVELIIKNGTFLKFEIISYGEVGKAIHHVSENGDKLFKRTMLFEEANRAPPDEIYNLRLEYDGVSYSIKTLGVSKRKSFFYSCLLNEIAEFAQLNRKEFKSSCG